jgi:hypothetical protein
MSHSVELHISLTRPVRCLLCGGHRHVTGTVALRMTGDGREPLSQ